MNEVEHRKCKNCSNFVESNYCPNCGQLYLPKQTLHHVMVQLLDVLDIRKGVIITTFKIFIQPHKLIEEYLKGRTKPYLHAVSFVLVTIGFFYLLSELEIFGFEILKSNQFRTTLDTIIPIAFASLIIGFIPYMKMTSAEVFIVNFYWLGGILVVFFLSEIAFSLNWIYQIGNYLDNSILLLFPFTIYFFGSTFRLKIHKTLTNLAIIFLSILGYDQLDQKFENQIIEIENSYKGLPRWAHFMLVDERDRFLHFQQKIDLKENPLIEDFSGDGVRDVAIITEDDHQHIFIIVLHFRENSTHLLSLDEIRPDVHNKKIVSCTYLENKGNLIKIEFEDHTIVYIKWNGNYYYSPKALA